MFDHIQPKLLVEMEQDLGIRVRAKNVAPRGQGCSQFAVVVNFAVESDDKRGLGASFLVQGHRLAAIGTEVDDCEAAMGESQSAIRTDPFSRGVRAATVHSS
jgi:hypothetical protein